MKLNIKRRTLIASVCAVLVTTSLMSKARTNSVSEVDFQADLDTSSVADLASVTEEANLVPASELSSAFANETSMALEESEVTAQDFNPTVTRPFACNENDGLTFDNSSCRRFIRDNGTYGDFGRIIESYLHEDLKQNPSGAVLFSNSIVGMTDGPRVCPKWKSLNDEQKIRFWVWTIAAISNTEASCNPRPHRVVGPTDATAGLLQLESGTRRNRHGFRMGLALRKQRGPNCASASTMDIVRPYANLRCGLDMMKQQLTSKDEQENMKFDYPVYPSRGMRAKSYWLKLRAVNGGPIGANIREFGPCH